MWSNKFWIFDRDIFLKKRNSIEYILIYFNALYWCDVKLCIKECFLQLQNVP